METWAFATRVFNISLLGIQAWRLLVNPDKLVSKVFNAWYYPSKSLLTAKVGSSPSYIWRRVLEALIKQGISCRIGNGKSLIIINTPWLSDTNDRYIQSSNEALLNQKVSSFMVTGERMWYRDLICDIFNDQDVEHILSIPLRDEDTYNWYWTREKMGVYSVKSTYAVLQEAMTNRQEHDSFWKKLWNLKIPVKVNNFLWRAASNCFPYKRSLT